MSRYIDVDVFIADKLTRYCSNCDRRKSNNGKRFIYAVGEAPCRACWVDDMIGEIEDYPAADVEEVRHGKDIYYTKNDEHCEFKCSVCNAWIGVVEGGTASLDAARGFNYCPACGAKMDKEKEE